MEHISKHLSKELLPPVSTPPAIGEHELSLCLAEPKIRNLPTVEPIKEALRYSMVLIGLRSQNWPTEEEKAILITYIVENYGGHTASEIRLAFKMAVAGKLEVEANCYENFSVLYFTGVMNAYRLWAGQAVEHIPKETPALPAPRISDEEFIESVRKLYNMHQDYLQIPPLAYKVLNLQLSDKKKEAIKTLVNAIVDEPTQDNYKQFAVAEYFKGNI